ncbi:Protein of unknown function [Thermobacillus xylanilyticus]|uniref:Uncharacterized protein n=1 Tax=Thermobacillus xylanilyticus TaxID=76633 RepID=A0ABM8V5B1_THEXY|nr:hypothetical protein [Thermobacillus xylanilyticus]CAG5088497.1 Protein of unknown function [Thermobacillus xylanilyticus]
MKTYIRRAVLIALFICLVGGGVYLGGVQLLKSVQRSEALAGYEWMLIAFAVAHVFHFGKPAGKKIETISRLILASVLATGALLFCLWHHGNLIQAAAGMMIYLFCVLVYQLIENKLLYDKQVQNR